MRKSHVPQTRVPGARRRVNPETHMPEHDRDGLPLWDMPAPIRYAEHTKWRKHKRTGKRIGEPIQVPVYRAAPASYVRWVKAQLRRQQRGQNAAIALVKELEAEEAKRLKEAQDGLKDTVLNPGGYDVSEAEDLAT